MRTNKNYVIAFVFLFGLLIGCSNAYQSPTNRNLAIAFKNYNSNYLNLFDIRNGNHEKLKLNIHANNQSYIHTIEVHDDFVMTTSDDIIKKVKLSTNGIQFEEDIEFGKKLCHKQSIILENFGKAKQGEYFWEIGTFDLDERTQKNYLNYNGVCYEYQDVFAKSVISDDNNNLIALTIIDNQNDIQLRIQNLDSDFDVTVNLDDSIREIDIEEAIYFQNKIYVIAKLFREENNNVISEISLMQLSLSDQTLDYRQLKEESFNNLSKNTRLYKLNNKLYVYDNERLLKYDQNFNELNSKNLEINYDALKTMNFSNDYFTYIEKDELVLIMLKDFEEIDKIKLPNILLKEINKGGVFKIIAH